MQVLPLPLVHATLALVDESKLPSHSAALVRHVATIHDQAGGLDGRLVRCPGRKMAQRLYGTDADRPAGHSVVSRRVVDLLARKVLIGRKIGTSWYLAVNANVDEWRVVWIGGKHAALLEVRLVARDLVETRSVGWRASLSRPYGATTKPSLSRNPPCFATTAATTKAAEEDGPQCFAGGHLPGCRGACRETGPFRDNEGLVVAPKGRDNGPEPLSLLDVPSEQFSLDGHQERPGGPRESPATPPQANPPATRVRDLSHGSQHDEAEVLAAADRIARAIRKRGKFIRGTGLDELRESLRCQLEPINVDGGVNAVRWGPPDANGLDLADLAVDAARELSVAPRLTVVDDRDRPVVDRTETEAEAGDRLREIEVMRALREGRGRVADFVSPEEA